MIGTFGFVERSTSEPVTAACTITAFEALRSGKVQAMVAHFSLDGSVAVVTGGSGALGSALVRGLASAGATVGVLARNPSTVGSGAVVVSLMLESLFLALAGGALGGGLAWFAFNNFHTSTMNFQSFSQVTFAFQVTPQLLVRGIIWAALIGLIGGLFPAIRAARLPIASALREL